MEMRTKIFLQIEPVVPEISAFSQANLKQSVLTYNYVLTCQAETTTVGGLSAAVVQKWKLAGIYSIYVSLNERWCRVWGPWPPRMHHRVQPTVPVIRIQMNYYLKLIIRHDTWHISQFPFHFFTLLPRASGVERLNTMLPLPTLLSAEYSVRLNNIYFFILI